MVDEILAGPTRGELLLGPYNEAGLRPWGQRDSFRRLPPRDPVPGLGPAEWAHCRGHPPEEAPSPGLQLVRPQVNQLVLQSTRWEVRGVCPFEPVREQRRGLPRDDGRASGLGHGVALVQRGARPLPPHGRPPLPRRHRQQRHPRHRRRRPVTRLPFQVAYGGRNPGMQILRDREAAALSRGPEPVAGRVHTGGSLGGGGGGGGRPADRHLAPLRLPAAALPLRPRLAPGARLHRCLRHHCLSRPLRCVLRPSDDLLGHHRASTSCQG